MTAREKPVIGWREWVALPDLGLREIKAKVDTGARSSTLHAFNVEVYRKNSQERVRFEVHPYQRDQATTVRVDSLLADKRWVRSSSGHRTLRPVIVTPANIGGASFEIELTLINRDSMGFRMLLGRQAVRGRFVIDPGKSFLYSKKQRRKKKGKRVQS